MSDTKQNSSENEKTATDKPESPKTPVPKEAADQLVETPGTKTNLPDQNTDSDLEKSIVEERSHKDGAEDKSLLSEADDDEEASTKEASKSKKTGNKAKAVSEADDTDHESAMLEESGKPKDLKVESTSDSTKKEERPKEKASVSSKKDDTDHEDAMVAESEKPKDVKEEGVDGKKDTKESHTDLEKQEEPHSKESKTKPVKEGETSKKQKEAQEELDDANAEDSEDESTSSRHEIEKKNYEELSQEDLVKEFERLLNKEKVQVIKEHVDEIRTEFNNKFDEESEQVKEDFLEDGGNIIDFHYATPIKKKFDSVYFDYREKRNTYYKKLKQNLNDNLKKREEIIEELKNMIGVGNNMHSNYKDFKKLQERWRNAGPIPRDKYNLVWNNYHHHVENFYDFLHLDREFRDLDFKHNLDQKLKIIARAEDLAKETNVNRAFRELQMLHKMWKEDLGPVAKDYRDTIWDKFSELTKQIHENRQAHYAELEKDFEKNLEVKLGIIDEISIIAQLEIKSHNFAQQKIKAVEALREKFFKAGKVPRAKNQDTWDAFKKTVRIFNRNKNAFYKNQKNEQYENLEKKKELIKIAEDNKDSDDYKTVTPLMKKIQADWKKIGHVPRKDSDKVWKRFKKACNDYFDKMHAERKAENSELFEAFDQKKEMLDKVKKLELEGSPEERLAIIKTHIEAWKELGQVPNNKRYIEGKFNKALDELFGNLDISRKKQEMLKYESRLQALEDADDDRRIEKEAYFIRKKVDETTSEIAQLENNLGFFQHVPDDNPMVKEVHENINKHKEELDMWKAKLQKLKKL